MEQSSDHVSLQARLSSDHTVLMSTLADLQSYKGEATCRGRVDDANIISLLRQREVSGSRYQRQCASHSGSIRDLQQWLEGDLLRHCSSAYCNNLPPLPRSTIALAFSPNGQLLASTHGDHTVKITCCKNGACLKVLREHERTPWAVKFHPTDSNILASGSLDSTVRIWDLTRGVSICSYHFGRPISSIAFGSCGDTLAIASGHRLYVWRYSHAPNGLDPSQSESPVLLLKTKRSLRAVQFHPTGAPLMLTAEVVSEKPDKRPGNLGNPPVDYTGVVDGLEVPEWRRRIGLVRDAQCAVQNPRAFGEELSQALQVLQASAQSEEAAVQNAPAIGVTECPMFPPGQDYFGAQELVQRFSYLAGLAATTASPVAQRGTPDAHTFQEMQPDTLQPRDHASPETSASAEVPLEGSARSNWRLLSPSQILNFRLQPAADICRQTSASQASAASQTTLRAEAKPFHPSRPLAAGQCTEGGLTASIPPGHLIPSSSGAHLHSSEENARQTVSSKSSMSQSARLSPAIGSLRARGRAAIGWTDGEREPHVVLQSISNPTTRGSNSREDDPREPGTSSAGTNQWPSESKGLRQHLKQSTTAGDAGLTQASEQQRHPLSSREGIQENQTLPGAIARDLRRAEGLPGTYIRKIPSPEASSTAGQAQPPLSNWILPAPRPGTESSASGDNGRDSRTRGGPNGWAPRSEVSFPSGHLASNNKEVGCHVLVRLWRYKQVGKPALEQLELAVHDTVLCSDMGLTLSPCGKMLALCAAPGASESSPSPSHDKDRPYELRVYSLEGGSFGRILSMRPIKAAHCLTAIQFSPGSRHLMLAYGRRDPSLQQQHGENARSMVLIHTVLEVYRVQDMSLVRMLPSADDEINTALFHPFMGCGLAYGTKEGRLRILTHSSRPLLGSKKAEEQGRLEDELLAAAKEISIHSSEEDA